MSAAFSTILTADFQRATEAFFQAGWHGCEVRYNERRKEWEIVLSVQCGSRIGRWMYRLGIKKLPPHPTHTNGMRVVTDVRGIARLY